MKKLKPKVKVTTERVETFEITKEHLLEFLEVKGDPLVESSRAYVRIPGGGDYSNQSLELHESEDGCLVLEVRYKEVSES